MCRKTLLLVLVIWLSAGTALGAPTSITVENYSFEIPGTGKPDIPLYTPFPAGTPGKVTGWARTDPTTSAGCEASLATNGSYICFMGKDAMVFNTTDFLLMEGDEFQMLFDTRGTGTGGLGDNMCGQIYYKDDAGNREVLATINVDLSNKGQTVQNITLDTSAVGLAARDHKVGVQFKHTRLKRTTDNIWAGIDYIRLSITTSLMRAQNPYPAYESFYTGDSVTLTWTPGPDAGTVDNYKVYLSSSWADVNSAAPASNKGTRDVNNCDVSGLVKGLIYYWRIDTVSGANTYRGNIWKFTTKPTTAYDPVPNTGAQYVAISPVLSWTAGSGAVLGHNVYFSDNLAAVTTAATGSIAVPFRANPGVADTNWAPSESGLTPLALSKTYYWRIDEVESASKIYKGTVWSFTTVPIPGLGSIMCQLYTGIPGGNVADLTNNANYPDNPSSTEYLTSFEAPHRAFVEYGSRVHGYLYIRNTGDYTFWIASGENSQLWLSTDEDPGNASIIARVEGGDGWTNPRQWDKYPDIQQSAPKHLEASNLYYIMVLHKKGWGYDNLAVAWQGPDQPNPPVNGEDGAIIPGISLVPWDPSKAVWAARPNPANNATNVEDLTPTLGWKPGVKAAKHDVYFSDKFEDVNSATTSSPTIYKGRFDPNKYDITTELNWGQTYYWRIDEVNDPNIWRGNIWHFTTRNYLILDDFESYNNTSGNTIISEEWIKGGGGMVGYPDPNYAEVTIIHAGAQSMPLDYNNTKSPYDSNATCTFDTPQNWTASGPYSLKALSLWFRGYQASVGSFEENPAGTYTITASGANIGDVSPTRGGGFHDEFHFGYKEVTAAAYDPEIGDVVTIVVKVESVGNAGDTVGKAGVMIRDLLDANSINGFMCIRRITGGGYGVAFQYRLGAAGTTAQDVNDTGITLPCWVKLVLDAASGHRTLRAYYSRDNSTWYQLPITGGSQQYPEGTMYLPRTTPPLYVGLAVTPQSTTNIRMAKFSNVSITAGAMGAWKHRDIGIKSNVASPLYVTLQDSNPSPGTKTVTHPDPYTLLQSTWQEWNIALSDFTGVDLTKVNKMTIGVGNRSAPQPVGIGTIYVDDIRLYIRRCIAGLRAPDFTGSDCLVDYQDLAILTDNWLISEHLVTPPAGWDPNSDPNLVGYYKFDGNFNDSSSKGNNGDPCNTGVTTITDPTRGKVASFDGINDYIAITRLVQDDFTLMAWLKTATPGARAGTQAWQGSGLIWSDIAGGQPDFILAVLGAKLSFGTGPNSQDTTSSGDVVTGQWVHVAVTRTRSSGQVQLFIDGILNRTAIHSNTGSLNANPEIHIGGNTLDLRYYTGLIDDVRIYSRVLSQGEVARLAGKTTPFTQPLSGLLTNPAVSLYSDGTIDLRDYATFADTWLEVLLWP